MTARAQPTPLNHSENTKETSHLTLMDHLHEIRARLFWIILFLVAASGIGYLLQDIIMAALMRPLGGQKLVYLTPIGGFNFLFKVSMYVGIGLILPVVIYHLYRFLEPLMDPSRKRSAFFYIVASFSLAIGGGTFAYVAGLPAALHFLTSFNIQNVSPMLPGDSYLSFVITYVLGLAALFQIPLVLMIINTIKPIPPAKLMGFQRFVVLVAFILAAIISPTPDITNQAMLAVPIIVMYQVGVILVWVQSRKQRRIDAQKTEQSRPTPQPIIRRTKEPSRPTAVVQPTPKPAALQSTALKPAVTKSKSVRQTQLMDIAPTTAVTRRPIARPIIPPRPTSRQTPPTRRPLSRAVSIDGFVV